MQDDVAALQSYRPGFPFWRDVFTVPDGAIVFASAADGHLIATLPATGDWQRDGVWETPALRDVLDAAAEVGVSLREVERDELDALARDHHGVVARVRLPAKLGERELASWPFAEDALVVVLDGIADPQNLGAAARAAEAAGASMLVSRTRRAADVTDAAIRASAGALLHLPHAQVANLARALQRLKDAGFVAAGLDETATATVYDEPAPPGRLAVVLGAEGEGMARLTREACDRLVSLPMLGKVRSLNASTSLAAVLYGW
jgi:23S rRNA (guanosine2251-2'-O)-methyltransferase